MVKKQGEWLVHFISIRSTKLTISRDIEHIWQMFWRHGFYRGGPVFMSALSGIDIALWDLKGKLLHLLSCSRI